MSALMRRLPTRGLVFILVLLALAVTATRRKRACGRSTTFRAYGYDRDVNRSIAVTTSAVTTVLRDVYGMTRLLAELGVR
jgi:hypothetical protein